MPKKEDFVIDCEELYASLSDEDKKRAGIIGLVHCARLIAFTLPGLFAALKGFDNG